MRTQAKAACAAIARAGWLAAARTRAPAPSLGKRGVRQHTDAAIGRRQSAPMKVGAILPAACLLFSVSSWAEVQPSAPLAKPLVPAVDPTKNAVPIGHVVTADMDFQLSLEGSEAMWMPMGTPPVWGAHSPAAAERFHVELKLTDPRSKTRIPYANVSFKATNVDTGKSMALALPPMWGSSGLHYSANSALLGDGAYAVTVTVDPPTFQRELVDKDLWSKAVTARFHFKLKDGKVTEVSTTGR
jgi:uncharacterized protein involved in high-affinity Fe2+ transport